MHYFNTLQAGAGLADVNHVGYSFRVLWEPEHRLSLGLESGYYTLYVVSGSSASTGPGTATLAVVPILVHVRMRIVDNFYLSAGTGVSILTSKADLLGSVAEGTQVSLADVQASALYLHPLGEHWRIGAEVKFLNIAKTEDYGLAVQAVAAFRF